jgi:ATP-dependent Clp protease ATP-binding subunit ClpA
MPSFTKSLEEAIHRAIALANERRHELATLEHLLLSLVDEEEASAVMTACGVDVGILRTALTKFVDEELESLISDIDGSEAAPTTGFQRVIQRAVVGPHGSYRRQCAGCDFCRTRKPRRILPARTGYDAL